ncbi:efflux RND transporter permease subunit [Methylococcus sp. EFPC2]|uniref:efflux RND transporter permease subunit n=1 Tax=Methylococcus sp. EFPC2 TaxID=2812648 RepID=UPI001967DEBA|nr:efflux RND transporter permease subunit [Methylococcus sp. EFPC2]QSA98895.1 efflux RND transporter permease subunit [Methylococcus sp. EFPC2]
MPQNPDSRDSSVSGLIAWFAANPVAANLLMLLILFGGAGSLIFMDKEVFPHFLPHQIQISAYYPGAGPLEIEESVCVRIEEAIYDLPGIKRLKSEITQGECNVRVEVLPDHDKDQVLNAVRGRVQAIQRLPKALEKIDVQPATRNGDDGVIWVALHGPTDPLTIKSLGDRIQADLARIPGVTRAYNYFDVSYEIAIEVSAEKLHQYRISLHEVTEAVRRASVDLPGGLVKSKAGELLLRVQGKAQSGESVGNLVLRTNPDGSRVLLRDVSVIKDGLEERLAEWHHDGETAQGWEVHAEHDTVAVARRVKAYVDETRAHLPEGLSLYTWWDDSQAYEERTRTLIEDGLSGFVLVCLVLTLFLRLRVALWADAGILTSVFGAFWLMPAFGVSLNMLSLFGFLLAMGILVDDAIIIGEAVHKEHEGKERGRGAVEAAIRGAKSVALPVTLAVLVALVAFLPGLFLPGWSGQMMRPICLVMILTLAFSLIEALLILPAHLAAPPRATPIPSRLARLRLRLNQGLDEFVRRIYRPFLESALAWRHLTVSAFAVLLMLSVALVAGGHVRLSLQADVTKDSFWVNLTLPQDAPFSETRRIAEKVEKALLELRDEMDQEPKGVGLPILDARAETGELAPAPRPKVRSGTSVIVGLETIVWENGAGFWTELSPQGRQTIKVEDFIRAWRERIGDVGRAKIDFLYKEGDVPYDLEFDLGASDPSILMPAAEELKRKLAAYPGVFDVVDSAEPGKPEVHLRLKPEAERLGLRLEELAEQVRQAYYGDEVHRFQRGRNEVKVMVRLPWSERRSLDKLEDLPVRLPNGAQAPLSALAQVDLTPGYAKLVRQDRQRILKVQARVDPNRADLNAVYSDLEAGVIPQLKQKFPGLAVNIGEERQEQEEATHALAFNTLISLAVIYALIAIPFRSYTKPLIFLLAAPVAWSGAVLAHWLAGLPLSMESLVGMIAASGVVVNDSLVLLDYIKEKGVGVDDTVAGPGPAAANLILEACTSRFRPILLAFLTNFAGFLPTLLETSEQAQFLIPMTLSLSAGLLIGMAASLILTPACYALLGQWHDRPSSRVISSRAVDDRT